MAHLSIAKKKPARNDLAGLLTMSGLLLVAGTVATRTHAPLARHMFYVFFDIDYVDTLAHYVGVGNSHRQSRANMMAKVKPCGISHPRPEGS
jgi:hypothetical protein